jgi:Fe-S cluster biosynthesis and repair protein YggX
MQLINHYALDVRTAEAREFLRRNVEAFLFGEGSGDEIDTSMEGKL